MCNAWNHPPGCTCGWGGDGHLGHSPGGFLFPDLPVAGTRSTWDAGDFCCPTNCPICGAKVFFVRHNGGSVWFDELGQPWPKHACFDDEYAGVQLRTTLREALRKSSPVFGVVIETEIIEPEKSGQIVVQSSDGTIIDDVFHTELHLTRYIGALVVVERADDGGVRLRQISTSPPYRWWPRPRLAEGARITLDRRDYIWDGRQWYGVDDYTIAPTGLQQRLNALANERLESTDDEYTW